MKKITIAIMATFLLAISACGSGDEEVKETKITINTNDVYAAPVKPTDYQAELYNKLTDALKSGNQEEVAKLVAQNFSADFFTLKNKKSAEDVGGLTYLPETRQELFKTFAMNYVYANYQDIVDSKGKSNLPVVKKVDATSSESSTFEYADLILGNEELGTVDEEIEDTYEGFKITVSIAYEDTSLKESELKTTTTFSIIDLNGRLVIIVMD